MFFYLHYILLTSGLSGTSVLLAVYCKTYSDASPGEVGALLMAIPFLGLVVKPYFCSLADRQQAHRLYLMLSLIVMMVGYSPFIFIPFIPAFYEQYPRWSWYVQVMACFVGASGLDVAWSLGDCLAMNHSQRTGTPFGRMRLMGTLSWGVYGFIIGQINETPSLPKYFPSWMLLEVSAALEILLLAFWNKRCFEMVDPLSNLSSDTDDKLQHDHLVNSVPSSLGGTLRANARIVKKLSGVFSTNDDELLGRLERVEQQRQQEEKHQQHPKQACENENNNKTSACELAVVTGKQAHQFVANREQSEAKSLENGPDLAASSLPTGKNPQLFLLKMIFLADGRLLKSAIVFTAFGIAMASLNFFFISLEGLCHERGYNFSQLAGSILMSQALIETLSFLCVPTLSLHISRRVLLSSGLLIMSFKFIFYTGWFYKPSISPYWAVVAEWSHGISYGIFCTIIADVSLLFANECRLFIPELRRRGYLSSDTSNTSKEVLEAEENSIKMALRATMSAIFGGFTDGLGYGLGSLVGGILSELYTYQTVWQIFGWFTLTVFSLHLLVEVTGSRWSDSYKPSKGTIAYEIMELSRATDEAQRQRANKSKRVKSTTEALDKSGGMQVVAAGNNGGGGGDCGA